MREKRGMRDTGLQLGKLNRINSRANHRLSLAHQAKGISERKTALI
jgi:hypothetical protein